MSESTLTLRYEDFLRETAYHIGFGRDATRWSSSQQQLADDAVQTGLRRVYLPPPVDGMVHEWTFLTPLTTLALSSGTVDYDLPDDFAGIVSAFTVSSERQPQRVVLTDELRIRRIRQQTTTSGPPAECAVVGVAPTTQRTSRWKLLVWPTPDASYVLDYRYRVAPNQLSALNPYPYGAALYSELFLAACLAAADERLNDREGVMHARFMERLAASIQADKASKGIEYLGYNGDPSVARRRYGRLHLSSSAVTTSYIRS